MATKPDSFWRELGRAMFPLLIFLVILVVLVVLIART
jgi:sensor domain CHASE-containing protein